MSQTTISVTEKIFPKQMSLTMKEKCLQDLTTLQLPLSILQSFFHLI
ncbi:unnamed protein product [Acanthoscelides obtectus]|uniref:Uncharacterized protein n=1 Tax=Acanthoscelides obtectus TaxID=200917 RepID=A0A9P0L8Y5_ACAOB|nr:unnamed protein product [Acanthoscelides obtectus]CAK1636433.1 hypothetical protein AOBTE_LOCUS9848 [Acanthoscelides obtectus]